VSYSVVQSKGNHRGSTSTTHGPVALNANVTAGNFVLVGAGWNSAAGSASCADSQGNSYSSLVLVNGGFFTVSIQVFLAQASASGALTVTITEPSTPQGELWMRELSSLAASPADDADGVDATTSAATTRTMTTTQDDDFIAYYEVANSPALAPSGYTLDINNGTGFSVSAYKNTPTPAGNVVVADTGSGGGTFATVALKSLLGVSGQGSASGPGRLGMFTPQMRSDAWF
jgi:hypothetical protein